MPTVYVRLLQKTLSEHIDQHPERRCRTCLGQAFQRVAAVLAMEVPVSDAARVAGCSTSHIRRLVRRGELTRRYGPDDRLRVILSELPMCRRERLAVVRLMIQLSVDLLES